MQWTLDEVVRVNVYTSTGNMAVETTVMSTSAVDRAGSIRTNRQTLVARNLNTVLQDSTHVSHTHLTLCVLEVERRAVLWSGVHSLLLSHYWRETLTKGGGEGRGGTGKRQIASEGINVEVSE